MGRIHIRTALATLVALAAVGSGAAYAASRTTMKPIGTGVVVIDTNLAYQGGSAAGTGMVLTSSGEILDQQPRDPGATTIKVVVPHTTHTYTARVVGYDTTADVAVLQLQKAANLKTVTIGNASSSESAHASRGRQRRRHWARSHPRREPYRSEQVDHGPGRQRWRPNSSPGSSRRMPGSSRAIRRAAAEQRRPRRRDGHRRIDRSGSPRRLERRLRDPDRKGNDDREADRLGQVVGEGAHRRNRVPRH